MVKQEAQRYMILDGLRGVFALFIIIQHVLDVWQAPSDPSAAGLSVDFFFLLGGFFLGKSLFPTQGAALSVGRFVQTRTRRLYPLYLVGLAVGAGIFALKALSGDAVSSWWTLTVAFAFGLFLLPQPLAFVDEGWAGLWALNTPVWSLSYMLGVSLLFVALRRHLSMRVLAVLAAVSGAVLAGTLLSGGHLHGGAHAAAAPIVLARVVFGLSFGMVLSRLRWRAPLGGGLGPFVGLSLALLVCFLAPFGTAGGLWQVVCLAVVFPLVIWAGAARQAPCAAPFLRWLGEMSYPLFVLHYPVLRGVIWVIRGHVPSEYQALAALVVCPLAAIGVAWLALVFIDRPLQAWAQQRRSPIGALTA